MAHAKCKVGGKKPISRVTTFTGHGRNRGRVCVRADLLHGRPDRRGKRGKGKLVDSEKRFLGCFGSAKKANAAKAKWDRKESVC